MRPVGLFLFVTGLCLASSGCQSGPFPLKSTDPRPKDWAKADENFYAQQGTDFPVRKRVLSWTDLKQQNVVMQKYDYSCGAAALATMFRYYFEDDVTEDDVLRQILKTLTPEEFKDRQENGLSMNDLFKVARDMGYLATVYRLPLDKIPELPAPMIVRIEKWEFEHFVVLRGAVGDRIYLADPSRGNLRIPVQQFVEQWSGEALILGKSGFGLPKDHPLALNPAAIPQVELDAARRWTVRGQ